MNKIPQRLSRGLFTLALQTFALSVPLAAFAQPSPPRPAPVTIGSPRVVPPAVDSEVMNAAAGFKVERLYSVPRENQGSWVCLTIDHRGRLIVGDQYGGLYRITLPPTGAPAGVNVEPLKAGIAGAHGLLYAFDSLYVMVNEAPDKGVFRLRDRDGDDQFEEIQRLCAIEMIQKAGNEHGPHSLALGPDGRSIYIANGNRCAFPETLQDTRPVAWGEDHLLPRMWDPRGHMRGKSAPGGYIARMDPDGKEVELLAMGLRNQFDLAFDRNGELFTYDSDMEWDQGTPWYVPTRINHIVDGADYGWRSGAGRWPAYYPDSLPAVVDLGPGCPTGMTFGTGAKFPAKYQRALFAADWTYGTLHAIHLEPDGASFRAVDEEFLSGKPLPLTDVIINPRDGAMYFIVGGRKTQSALYRVTYIGSESTTPGSVAPPTPEAKLRRSLEKLHLKGTGPEAIATAWPHLASPDRFIRFAARVAIEKQPSALWTDRALVETRPRAAIEALIALGRVGDGTVQPRLLHALERIDFAAQPQELQLPLLRAWHLAFTRLGRPSAEIITRLAAKFDPLFPHRDPLVNRELIALLIYLDSPSVVARAVPLLSVSEPIVPTPEELGGPERMKRNDHYGALARNVSASRADRQQIALAYALRNATRGWTPKLHAEYFSWFVRTQSWKGGMSFRGFLDGIRTDALAKVAEPGKRAALSAVSKPAPPSFMATAITPKGPGSAYTVKSALAALPQPLRKGDFARGKALFTAAACSACHRCSDEGGTSGPDLSGAGSRYSVRDLLESIIEPSAVISDQYGSEQLDLADGSTVIGRVSSDDNGDLLVSQNPFLPDEKTRVKASAVKTRRAHTLSIMPPGLINALNPDELKDLLAYILAGGNPADPMFAK